MTDSVNIFFINPAIDLLQYFSVSTSLKVLKSITSFKRSSSSSIDAAILKIPSAKQIYRLFFIVSIRIDKIRGTFLLSSIVWILINNYVFFELSFQTVKWLWFFGTLNWWLNNIWSWSLNFYSFCYFFGTFYQNVKYF